jgi:hypothetical protein
MGRSGSQERYSIRTRIGPQSPEYVIGLAQTQLEVEPTPFYMTPLSVATWFALSRPETFLLLQPLP